MFLIFPGNKISYKRLLEVIFGLFRGLGVRLYEHLKLTVGYLTVKPEVPKIIRSKSGLGFLFGTVAMTLMFI